MNSTLFKCLHCTMPSAADARVACSSGAHEHHISGWGAAGLLNTLIWVLSQRAYPWERVLNKQSSVHVLTRLESLLQASSNM